MANFYTPKGKVISVDSKISKLAGLKKAPDDAKLDLMQHANSVVSLSDGKRTVLDNDFQVIADHVNTL